ncbi:MULTISPECIES: hypothetical protein [Methylobacterium]|uniref:Uncharacterized protein n=2 Tax=Methylobacterium TaxID=407 RepID=A0A0C6G021_9HYPH|nr:hypothetical protein [Methylobacterium aquaticum]BAQ49050.1 hypothetical protein Maq22A_1p33810 [Methylobacterium aquaticum]
MGRRSPSIFDTPKGRRLMATSARVAKEVWCGRDGVPDLPEIARIRAGKILDGIDVVDAARYAGRIEGAARILCEAVASRNGSASDAHVLACAPAS